MHVDHDNFIMFDTPSERVMCRFVTCADDIRTLLFKEDVAELPVKAPRQLVVID